MPTNFVRTSHDADSNTPDACCGNFVGASRFGTDLPDNERDGNTVYCYIRCGTCGALHRDGFLYGYTKYEYTGVGDPPVPFDAFDGRWEVSHIDDNELHDGRASVVSTPPADYDPVQAWVDDGRIDEQEAAEYDAVDPTNYQKQETYVYRFSEVDRTTVSPVIIGGEYMYQPHPTTDDSIPIEITDLVFDGDWTLTEITAEPITTDDTTDDADADHDQQSLDAFVPGADATTATSADTADDSLTFTPAEFKHRCVCVTDPYSGIIGYRPRLQTADSSLTRWSA